MSAGSPAIDVVNLCYRYHDGSEALRGVKFRIENGEKVCLAGPNGAGKSTLLLCLAGLLKAAGQLKIGGSGSPRRQIRLSLDLFFSLPMTNSSAQRLAKI